MIYGTTIRLRALERGDVPTVTRWFNDPDVRRNLKVEGPISIAMETEWFERLLAAKERIYGIEVPSDGGWRHIGNIGLHGLDWRDRTGTVGIVIGEPDDRGKGHGRDAIRALARYAFEELNLHRLELQVFGFNERARRCYEACGFKHEGVRRAAVFRNGRYHDSFMMGLLAAEFSLGHAPARDGDPAPQAGPAPARDGDPAPQAGHETARDGDPAPQAGHETARDGDPAPQAGHETARNGDPAPHGGDEAAQ